ncbi:fungal-specific transcription factor domain-containing protein [Xylariaceae sp. FL0016]|nr:fungal-specific transcription factor domain-containing protein [Xylariaceae sp. FL0016]
MAISDEQKTAEPKAEPIDILNQENVSQRANAPKRNTKQQVRHRASVACASCRDRRIRCIVKKGERECTACQRTSADCVIKNDDERRRPISKAYMSSLADRIDMLEGMLLEQGVMPPPPSYPPKSRHESNSEGRDGVQIPDRSPRQPRSSLEPSRSPHFGVPSPPDSHEDFGSRERPTAATTTTSNQGATPLPETLSTSKKTYAFRMLSPKQENIVHRLLSPQGDLSFDQISGRLRFFGSTADSHVYVDSADGVDSTEPPEQTRRAQRMIRTLPPETYNYLMAAFWECYNEVLQVIDRDAFEADRGAQSPRFYSSFLHVTILAMGYRFADKQREDIVKVTLGNRESILHREAKYMLDLELERPGGIPSIQALLILGDLECGVGRDNTGWMYSGMANRLAFDIGLHRNYSNTDLSRQEVGIRNKVIKACVLFDKYWALFLGRPTSIKSQDIAENLISKKFTSPISAVDAKPPDANALGDEIYEQLVELMEMAGRIVEIRDRWSKLRDRDDNANVLAIDESEDSAYLHVISLDRQLQNWYRHLPDYLAWKPANIKNAPFGFFLLHQQYHVTLILLHRPWADYRSIVEGETNDIPQSSRGSETSDHHGPSSRSLAGIGHDLELGDPSEIWTDSRTTLSRNLCTQQAIRVARIFWQSKQRFDVRKICVTGIQHASTAAVTLLAAIGYQNSEVDQRSLLGYLEILTEATRGMSETYQPAAGMGNLITAVLGQLRPGPGSHVRAGSSTTWRSGKSPVQDSPYSVLPLRRDNMDSDTCARSNKRPRRTHTRRASEFSRPPPPFFSQVTDSSPVQGQQSTGIHHQSVSISHPFTGLTEVASTPSHLEKPQSPTFDLEGIDKQSGHSRNSSDNYLLVAPSTEGWGLHTIRGDRLSQTRDFDFSEWVSASMNVDASIAIDASGPVMDENAHEMGHGGANALSPGSLGGLVQSSESVVTSEENNALRTPRNHELDFLSF